MSGWRLLFRGSDTRNLVGLLHESDMRYLLARERMRSDRSGAPLCLIRFTPPGGVNVGQYQAVLGRTLLKRLRATDDCGWLEPNQLGALLPETGEAGAWCVAQEIAELTEQQGLPAPEVEVFVYPWPASDAPVPDDIEDSTARRRSSDLANYFATNVPIWKRGMDLLGGMFAIVLLSPFILLTALAIKATSRGPVIYTQYREGLGGRRFLLYKFRTMYVGAERHQQRLRQFSEQDGPAFKMSDDPRTTPLGRWLRRTSIDELPQLWNVLRGEMSLVGPRPLPWEESRSCSNWQRRRLDVLPGITCIWQVKGRSRVTFSEWVRMDLEYIARVSFWRDLWILIQTVPAVLSQKGAR